MSKRYLPLQISRFSAICTVVIASIVLMMWSYSSNELRYQGKSLYHWLEQFHYYYEGGPEFRERLLAEAAIRDVGTNAIPYFLSLLTKRDSDIRRELIRICPRWLNMHQVRYQRRLGTYGFIALGPSGRDAIPTLIRLAEESDPEVRYSALYALGYMGIPERKVVRVLVRKLDDAHVQSVAAECLGVLHVEPEICIPALVKNIEMPPEGSDNSYFALRGLAGFGTEARSAISALLTKLNDERNGTPSFRQMITNTIRSIDPETAVKLGLN